MLKYKVKADRDVIVEGLAVLYADKEYTFSEYDESQYTFMSGLRLNQGNMPKGVTLTVVVVPEEKKEA